MRRFLFGTTVLATLVLAATVAPGCGSDETSASGDGGLNDETACSGFGCTSNEGGKPGCIGLECKQVSCEGSAKTTVTGTVFDPAGKVPVFNATVYVPNAELADIPAGASACDRCDAQVSGKPIAITATDTSGKFTLENVPTGDKIPLVIQIGKWRRKAELPAIAKCVDTPLDAAITRLPRNRNEGNIPRIALTTGAADPLQCLLRKIGVDLGEFGLAGSASRIHMYAGGGFTQGTPKLASSKFGALNGGATFGSAQTLWSDVNNLKNYDIVLLSCEGDENEATKPTAAKQALYDYAKGGGRVFASHYHEVWLRKSPEPLVSGIATWAEPERQPPALGDPATTPVNASITAAFPKAVAMSEWLTKQNALSAGKLPIIDARHNVDAVGANGLNWISVPNPNSLPTANVPAVQYMTFNTPVGAADDAVCGRVVFSNLHVGAGTQNGKTDDPQGTFPEGCQTEELSAQQKALEFMLFDLSSCVQKDDSAVVQPR